jgi:hypothetical protein
MTDPNKNVPVEPSDRLIWPEPEVSFLFRDTIAVPDLPSLHERGIDITNILSLIKDDPLHVKSVFFNVICACDNDTLNLPLIKTILCENPGFSGPSPTTPRIGWFSVQDDDSKTRMSNIVLTRNLITASPNFFIS